MLEKILQEPFTILLALILIVSVWGLVSTGRDSKRQSRELTRLMALLEFNTDKCCECEHREDCPIFISATGRADNTGKGSLE